MEFGIAFEFLKTFLVGAGFGIIVGLYMVYLKKQKEKDLSKYTDDKLDKKDSFDKNPQED
jgi:uncharacterized membrane protein YgaE (UPF0421/DUF939 family)